jgi:prepilin-type N-terminal cleavage/methylation domain-containing protein
MRRHRQTRRAFTLIEMLVVIGIIVLLVGLLMPMILKSFHAAARQRAAADLGSVSIALDAYHSDFGIYPPVTVPSTGFAVLGKALASPFGTGTLNVNTPTNPNAGDVGFTGNGTFSTQYVAVKETAAAFGTAPDWQPLPFMDGADGPGFRAHTDPNGIPQGRVYPSYVQLGKFKMRGLALLDHFGQPILYFPASAVKINLANTTPPLPVYVGSTAIAGTAQHPMYNFDDNAYLATSLTTEGSTNYDKALARLQAMMGAVTNIGGANPGVLAQGEPPTSTLPYILWSCGPDGRFGPSQDVIGLSVTDRRDACVKCDDVTNFQH